MQQHTIVLVIRRHKFSGGASMVLMWCTVVVRPKRDLARRSQARDSGRCSTFHHVYGTSTSLWYGTDPATDCNCVNCN